MQKICTEQTLTEIPTERPPPANSNGLSDFDENSADDEEINKGDGKKNDAGTGDAANNRNQPAGEAAEFDYTKTPEYRELHTEFNQNLLCAIKFQLKNSSALVRRATVLLLEFAATTNLDIDPLILSYVSSDFRLASLDFE